jgi:hypothetical protein
VPFSRVYSCSARIVALRCTWTTSRTSASGEPTASASLIANSSRAGAARSTGLRNQSATLACPAAVIW